jgi:hypothetical protein
MRVELLALGLLALRNDRVTLRVPADHAAGLVDALLHLYQAKAETLQQRTNELIRGEGSADRLVEARDELRSLEQAIEELGWDPASRDRTVEVTAERAVMREATLGAIDEAGERLSADCTALLRGEGTLAAVERRLEGLQGLLELLRAVSCD